MDNSLISQDIIEKRKQQAPLLRSLQSETDKIISELETIEHSGAFDSLPAKISEYKKKLEDVRERVEHKLHLFEKGVIHVAVAGTEKAGKTTFLQKLTGIISLPDAKERCTAVSCEIRWIPSDKEPGISVVYYTESEVKDIIERDIKYLNDSGPQTWLKQDEEFTLPTCASLDNFCKVSLPNADALSPTSRPSFEPVLSHLHAIQQALAKDKSVLGQTKSSSLDRLEYYVKHRAEVKEQALIRKVLVEKNFRGDMGRNLCLCDTPGVDDPNPEAMRRTLGTLKEETDMLVILDRPKDSPSMTKPLTEFLTRLGCVSSADYPIRERAIFLVNWYEAVDTNRHCADERRNEVLKWDVFPKENLPEPCDVMNDGSLDVFWGYLNERLRDTLPVQDIKVVQSLRDEVHELKTGVLTDVVKVLENQTPPLPEEQRAYFEADFDKWFEPEGDREGFMNRLRSRLITLTEKPWEDRWLDGLVEKVKKISLKSREEIIKAIGEDVTEEKIPKMKKKAEDKDVAATVFSKFQGMFSKYVEELTGAVVEIGPYIVNRVEEVIRYALGEKVAARISDGGTLIGALQKEAEQWDNKKPEDVENVRKIAEGLADLVNVQDKLGHISRYELRPALNLIDYYRWIKPSMERLKEKTLDFFEHFGESSTKEKLMSFLRDPKTEIPSASDPVASVKFLRGVFAASLYYIEEMQRSNKKRFEALMEDYASNARLSLGTQDGAKTGWKNILRRHEDIIVPGYADRAKNGERAKLCHDMTEKLRKAVGD